MAETVPDRREELRAALNEILAAQRSARRARVTPVSWPLGLVDAVLKSEAAGDADAQDRLIEAIATILGLGADERLTAPEALGRLIGDDTRAFIISTLHDAQAKAERESERLKAEKGYSEHIEFQEGQVTALALAIEVVNISALPGDNDQQIGELITRDDARLLEDLISGDHGPEEEDARLLRRRLRRIAKDHRIGWQ